MGLSFEVGVHHLEGVGDRIGKRSRVSGLVYRARATVGALNFGFRMKGIRVQGISFIVQ